MTIAPHYFVAERPVVQIKISVNPLVTLVRRTLLNDIHVFQSCAMHRRGPGFAQESSNLINNVPQSSALQ